MSLIFNVATPLNLNLRFKNNLRMNQKEMFDSSMMSLLMKREEKEINHGKTMNKFIARLIILFRKEVIL